MNLFGLEIKAASRNGHYVKPHECHQARQDYAAVFNQRIDDLERHIDKRLDVIHSLIQDR